VSGTEPESERQRRDALLATRAQAGDRAALAEIYRAYAQPIFVRALLPRLGNRDAAADCLAETFQSAFEHISEADLSGGGLYGWLMRIAKNKAIDTHRRTARGRRALGNFQALVQPLWASADDGVEAMNAQIDSSRIRAQIELALGSINPRYRQAIELRCINEASREDCAQELGVQLGTFDVLMLRALRAFRSAWTEAHGQEP